MKPYSRPKQRPKATKSSFNLHIDFDSGGQEAIPGQGEGTGIKRVLAVVKLDNFVFGRNWPKKDNLFLLQLYTQGECIVLIKCYYRPGLKTYSFYRPHLLLIKTLYKLALHITFIQADFSLFSILL